MTTALLEPEPTIDELPGDYPARGRIIVTDTSGNNQLGAIWGVRSRYYDSSSTAALFYEAEALTPVNGASNQSLGGASAGVAVELISPPEGVWVSMLTTEIISGSAQMTHKGSYRVWARCYSGSTTPPSFQFLWGVGSLSVPVTNTTVTLPGSGAFYLLDLGEVRLDYPPVGTQQWFGVVQVYANTATGNNYIDCLYLQPLDDGAGVLTYVNEPPSSSISTTDSPSTAANDATSGSVAWSNPSSALALDNAYATAAFTSNGQTSEWLKLTGYNFSLPSSATVKGIEMTAYYNQVYTGGSGGGGILNTYRLAKAGTIQTLDLPTATPSGGSYSGGFWITEGGPTDLWGASWAYSDINNSGFGAAVQGAFTSSGITLTGEIDYISMTVYYTLASGFTVSQDAVVYANQAAEIRYDQMVREGSSGTVYGPVSTVVGDLARIPPSGIEGRAVQVFVKPTRGDCNTQPDSGLDGATVQVRFRPSWIFRP